MTERDRREGVAGPETSGRRVRSPKVFRALVMAALAGAPAAAGCSGPGPATPNDPGNVGTADAVEPVVPVYGIPEPGPQPMYGVEPPPEPVATDYGVPSYDPGVVAEYMAPMPSDYYTVSEYAVVEPPID